MVVPTIAVSGGKGGTGKSIVATNLAVTFAEKGYKVLLIDADVDAPNVHILMNAQRERIKTVHTFLPVIDEGKCIKCGLCAQACRAHALVFVIGKYPYFFPELCTSCGACEIVCPVKAISDGQKVMGWIYKGKNYGVNLLMGELKLGEASAAAVVVDLRELANEMLEKSNPKYDLAIIDTSPGAHCDVLRSIINTNLVVAVTEPTPFGAHDLKRLIQLANVANVPVRIVVNRYGISKTDDMIQEVAKETNFPVITRIPYDEFALKAYAMGVPLVKEYPTSSAAKAIKELAEKVEQEVLK